MEYIPIELQHHIFGLLDSGSLASLCLVSKHSKVIAGSILYKHLVLSLVTFGDIDHALTLIIRATSQIRVHTRALTIIDNPAPAEALSARKLPHRSQGEMRRMIPTVAERDQTLYFVVSSIPHGRLHIFRHLSSRSLSYRIFEHLSFCQQDLHFLQVSMHSNENYRGRFREFYKLPGGLQDLHNLRTVDITFLSVETFVGMLHWLDNDRCAMNVRNLRIHADAGSPVDFAKAFKKQVAEVLRNSLRLEQLTLDGFDMRDLYLSVSTFTQVQLLTHLTLCDCNYTSVFFYQLTNILIKTPRMINLRHIAATLNHVDQQDIDTCLTSILKTCKLESLHLVWDHTEGRPEATIAAMPLLAKSLRSFSLHYSKRVHVAEEEVFYLREGLGPLVGQCHNLSQLGVQADEYLILPQVWEAPLLPQHIAYWSALKDMPFLTIMHLRQYEVCQHPGERSEKDVAWDLERFASGLFAFLDRQEYCPRLRCLVIGMRQSPVFSSRRYNSIPRHYFLKAKQKVGCNTEKVVAASVTLEELQLELPAATILDYDPGCRWLGGRPGQFHHY